MKVMDALPNITSVPHIFETPDDIIINSQIYDKHTMKPREYCFFNFTNVLTNFNLLDENINRIGDKNCIPDKGVDYKHIMQDTEDRSIFYVLYFIAGDSVTLRLSKIKKQESTYTILSTALYQSPNTHDNRANMYKFLGQTKDYILLSEAHWASHQYSDLRNIIVRRVSKQDLSSVYLIDYASNEDMYYQRGTSCFACSHFLIKNNDSYAYLYIQYGANAFIRKYNILNNTWANLYVFPSEYINGYCIGVSNIIEFNEKYYIITGNVEHTDYELQEITIEATDNVLVKHYVISHENFPYSYNGYRPSYSEANALGPYLVYTLKNINNEYIGLTVHHNEGFGIGTNNKHILIKKEDSGFRIVDVKPIPSCFGVLYYNPTTSVILTTEGFAFYSLKNDAWIEVYKETGTFNYIGFDSYKRFYSINSLNEVNIQSNITTVQLECRFIGDEYTYTGANLYTQCYVYAKNFLDEIIPATIKVTLSGPATFADNTKEKIVNTKKGEATYLDVYVKGSGKIEVNAVEEV